MIIFSIWFIVVVAIWIVSGFGFILGSALYLDEKMNKRPRAAQEQAQFAFKCVTRGFLGGAIWPVVVVWFVIKMGKDARV